MDTVFTRCSLYKCPGDIYAADLYYHNQCMSRYILQYKRRVNLVLDHLADDESHTASGDIFTSAFQSMIAKIDINQNG